jgi:hypothetical protein
MKRPHRAAVVEQLVLREAHARRARELERLADVRRVRSGS